MSVQSPKAGVAILSGDIRAPNIASKRWCFIVLIKEPLIQFIRSKCFIHSFRNKIKWVSNNWLLNCCL